MLASCEEELPHRVVTPIDAPAEVSLSIDGVSETIGLMAPKTKAYTMTIKAATKADQLLTFTVGANPDKVAAYNAAHGTDYEMVPGEAYELTTKEFYLPRYNDKGSTGTLTLKANGLPDDGKTRVLPISITKVEGDSETTMTESDSTVYITVYRISLADIRFEKGQGTEADPYLVEYANDMLAMTNDLKSGEPTYIKLANDIDMSTIEEWMPVNITEPYKTIHFDGDGHTIKNLYSNAADMTSIFGVLKGSFKNVTIQDATLETGVSQAGSGVVAGKAIDAEIKDVTVKGLTINSVGGNNNNGKNAGGLVGIAENCTIKNVNVEVNFVDADADNKMPRALGGLVGWCTGKVSTIDNCHIKGTVFGHHYVGGLIGIVGVDGMEVTNSSADAKITTLGNYCGGFIGYVNKGFKVSGCSSKGTLTHSGNYHGGFIGVCQGEAEIKRCSAGVDITNEKGTHVGAFIGNLGKGTSDYNDNTNLGNSLVEDCYATGSITVTNGNGNSGRMNAGFVAMIEKINDCTIRRCYASGDVIANANGPIGGLVAGAHMGAPLDGAVNFTMEKSIAWNGKIVSTPANTTTWSSGAIIGTTAVNNTLTDNYRRADMEYVEKCDDTVWTPFDQENVSGSSPLPLDGNKAPYHGKAAPAGATCSSVAKSLNWPEDVWDLSGDMPKLK